VTEEFVSVNPKSNSRYKETIIENANRSGLKVLSIDELHEKSVAKAKEFGKIPSKVTTSDEIVHAVEWRDGTLLDVIRKPVV